jgi:DNA-binding NarL/FixJ family response regulator
MSQRSPRVEMLKSLLQQYGVSGLAQLELQAVRQREVPPKLIERLTKSLSKDNLLSPREREVMVLLTSGMNRHEIARELDVTYNTINSHTRHIYIKLGVHNRQQAINAFLERAA